MAKKVAFIGMFIALAMVLGWLEALVPISLFIPGIKLGLANVVTLFVLYRFGWLEAGFVSILRVLLSNLLFGNLSLFLYGITGAVLSLIIMAILRKTDKFSVVGVSIAGGVVHNVAQIIVAILLMENGILLYYLPVLLVAGTIAGVVIGLIGAFLDKRIPEIDE